MWETGGIAGGGKETLLWRRCVLPVLSISFHIKKPGAALSVAAPGFCHLPLAGSTPVLFPEPVGHYKHIWLFFVSKSEIQTALLQFILIIGNHLQCFALAKDQGGIYNIGQKKRHNYSTLCAKCRFFVDVFPAVYGGDHGQQHLDIKRICHGVLPVELKDEIRQIQERQLV